MGLDMYLYHKSVGAADELEYGPSGEFYEFSNGTDGNKLEKYAPIGGWKEAAYWRKANAIHGWFVREVQGGVDNCEMYPVPVEKLAELLTIVEGILFDFDMSGDDIDSAFQRAQDKLPVQPGFFFGSTNDPEQYYVNLEDTAYYLKRIVASAQPGEYFYQSSW